MALAGGLYATGWICAPFPLWTTYRVLWKTVFTAPWPWRTRWRQARFLMKAGLRAPCWTLLWYLDEWLYPEYRRREITPVFIIGQPRCGSTFLHRTLAKDSDTFFAVRHLEWRYPFIILQKAFHALGLDKRLGDVNYWPQTASGALAARMHANTLADWEEDGIFFEEIFLHHFFIFLRFPDPALLTYLTDFPQLPRAVQDRMLDIHHRVIQKVQYLRGPEARFYLSKEVTSHNKIPALMQKHPHSRFIVLTRKSEDFMSSLHALMRTSTEVKTGVDPSLIPGWKEAFVQHMTADCLRLTQLCEHEIPAHRQFRISFPQLMRDTPRVVGRLYKNLGFQLSRQFADSLNEEAHNQQTRDRGYSYDILALEGFETYDAFVEAIMNTSEQRTLSIAESRSSEDIPA